MDEKEKKIIKLKEIYTNMLIGIVYFFQNDREFTSNILSRVKHKINDTELFTVSLKSANLIVEKLKEKSWKKKN